MSVSTIAREKNSVDNMHTADPMAVDVKSINEQPAKTRPGLYYGWVMLPISIAGLIATSPAQTFGVSIFNEPIRLSLNLSHGQIAAAYTLGTLFAALPLAYFGALLDRHGLRRSMAVVVVLFGFACLATSQVAGWWSLFVAFFALRFLGPGALSMVSSNTLAYWFHRRLGMVEGIRQVGMAASMAVVPIVNLWLIEQFGWRGSYAFLGIAIWCAMLPLVAFAFRNRPEDVGQRMDNFIPPNHAEDETAEIPVDRSLAPDEALRTRSFWIVAAGTGIYGIIHTAVFFSIVSIYADRGLTDAHAAQMLTVFAISLAAMQFIGGILADHVRATILLPVSLAGLSLAMFLLTRVTDPLTGCVCGTIMGCSQGLFFSVSNPLWVRYFGRMHLGKIRGTVATLTVGSSSLGPMLFGFGRDWLGNYDAVLLLFTFAPLPLMVLCCFASPPVRRDDDVPPAAR
ncbi:MAG: MFS transporter [Planctomycetaceae bacterium]